MHFNLSDLKDILNKFSEMSISPFVGIELEFYLKTKIEELFFFMKNDLSFIFDDNVIVKKNKISSDIGVYEIEKEEGEDQFEIKFSPTIDLFKLIENINFFRNKILSHNLASFDAMPFSNMPGSAMHVNVSFVDFEKNNIFNDTLFFQSIAGLCKFIPNCMIYFAPNESSYMRYVNLFYHTPSTISWGNNNRTVAIRSPETLLNKQNKRIENRLPCSDANVLGTISAILFSMYYGISRKINPPIPVYGIANDIQYCLKKVPMSIQEARKEFPIYDFIKKIINTNSDI